MQKNPTESEIHLSRQCAHHQPYFRHTANEDKVGRPIPTMSDEHLKRLTGIRVRASLRSDARQRIMEEACSIIDTVQSIMGLQYSHCGSIGDTLRELEQRIEVLLHERAAI